MKLCEFSIKRIPSIGTAALQTPEQKFKHDVLSTIAVMRMREECPLAYFLGRQERSDGTSFALFNVRGGELDGSTVSAATCREYGIKIVQSVKGGNKRDTK